MKKNPDLHFLHISKTGGVAFKEAFNGIRPRSKYINFHSHGFTFQDVVDTERGRCVFFIRDVVTRFVSGFNSRLRKGRPYADADWEQAERVIFKRFFTPNDLAEALSSESVVTRRSAYCGMMSMWHTRFPQHFWLHSADFLPEHKDRILFIARQETLDTDIPMLLDLLDLDEADAHVRMPKDEVMSHRTPDGFSTELSELGEKNIREWYREDQDILDWCAERREQIIAAL